MGAVEREGWRGTMLLGDGGQKEVRWKWNA